MDSFNQGFLCYQCFRSWGQLRTAIALNAFKRYKNLNVHIVWFCGRMAPAALNALHWLEIDNLFGRGFVPFVLLCPAFIGRVFVRFACPKTRVFAVCLRRPCRLALSAGRLSASAGFALNKTFCVSCVSASCPVCVFAF